MMRHATTPPPDSPAPLFLCHFSFKPFRPKPLRTLLRNGRSTTPFDSSASALFLSQRRVYPLLLSSQSVAAQLQLGESFDSQLSFIPRGPEGAINYRLSTLHLSPFLSSSCTLLQDTAHLSHSTPLSRPLFSYSYALFCTPRNTNSRLFNHSRTLCEKHPGVGGGGSLGRSNQSFFFRRYPGIGLSCPKLPVSRFDSQVQFLGAFRNLLLFRSVSPAKCPREASAND